MRIEVTADHARRSQNAVELLKLQYPKHAKAVGSPPHCCPLALAMRDAGIGSAIVAPDTRRHVVLAHGAILAADGTTKAITFSLPPEAADAVFLWDKHHTLEPFGFDVELP